MFLSADFGVGTFGLCQRDLQIDAGVLGNFQEVIPQLPQTPPPPTPPHPSVSQATIATAQTVEARAVFVFFSQPQRPYRGRLGLVGASQGPVFFFWGGGLSCLGDDFPGKAVAINFIMASPSSACGFRFMFGAIVGMQR